VGVLQAEEQEQSSAAEAVGEQPEQKLEAVADSDGVPTPAQRRAAERRLSSGRVSYAGKAMTVYFPTAEDKDRVLAAFAAHGGMEGYTSASEWMADVILDRTEQWERDYNGGQPFTDVLVRRQARRRRR